MVSKSKQRLDQSCFENVLCVKADISELRNSQHCTSIPQTRRFGKGAVSTGTLVMLLLAETVVLCCE